MSCNIISYEGICISRPSDSNSDSQKYDSERHVNITSVSGKIYTNRGDFPTMRTASECVCQCIKLKCRKMLETLVHYRSILNELTKNVSWQWPQVTLHIPGIVGTGGVTGEGARLIIRLQFGRGHATRCEEDLQINRQLQGQRTYFFPGGAFRIG